jgi:hypothetical protein
LSEGLGHCRLLAMRREALTLINVKTGKDAAGRQWET